MHSCYSFLFKWPNFTQQLASSLLQGLVISLIGVVSSGCEPDQPTYVEGKRLTAAEKELVAYQVGDSIKFMDQQGNRYAAVCTKRQEKLEYECLLCLSQIRDSDNTFARIDMITLEFATNLDPWSKANEPIGLKFYLASSVKKDDPAGFSKFKLDFNRSNIGDDVGYFSAQINPEEPHLLQGFTYQGNQTIQGVTYRDVQYKTYEKKSTTPYIDSLFYAPSKGILRFTTTTGQRYTQ